MTGKKLILDSTLKAIADAIRSKTGKSAKMTPAQMKTEIGTLSKPSGTKTVSVSANGTRTENIKSYENVKIQTNVSPNLTQLSVTQNGTYTPQTGMDGFSAVTVDVQGGGGGDEAPIIILAQNGPQSALNTGATAKTSGSTKPTSLAGLFCGWKYLQGADISGLDTAQVTDISYLFSGCALLQSMGSIRMPVSGFQSVQRAQGVFSGCGFTSLDPTAFIQGAQDISYLADYSENLQAVSFGAGCLANAERADGMFCGDEQLTALDFSNTGLQSVEHMASAFSGCSALETVNFSGCNFSHITYDPDEGGGWDYIFEGCTALESIQTDVQTVFPDAPIDLSATAVLTAQSLQNILNALPQSQNGATLTLNQTVYDSADPNIITMIENKGWTVSSYDPYSE